MSTFHWEKLDSKSPVTCRSAMGDHTAMMQEPCHIADAAEKSLSYALTHSLCSQAWCCLGMRDAGREPCQVSRGHGARVGEGMRPQPGRQPSRARAGPSGARPWWARLGTTRSSRWPPVTSVVGRQRRAGISTGPKCERGPGGLQRRLAPRHRTVDAGLSRSLVLALRTKPRAAARPLFAAVRPRLAVPACEAVAVNAGASLSHHAGL
jgi:hypothetical protein